VGVLALNQEVELEGVEEATPFTGREGSERRKVRWMTRRRMDIMSVLVL